MSDRLPLAIVLILIAFFLFSSVDVNAKWLAAAAFPVFQLAFFRYLGHFVVTLGQTASIGLDSLRLEPRLTKLVLLRSLLIAVATLCNFVAISYLPLTTTATIAFAAPIFVCALSGPLLGEHVGPWRWGAIAVGFLGVLIAMRPDSGFHWSMVFSVIATVSFALYSLMSRQLAGQVSVAAMQFYTGLLGTVVLAPLAFSVWVMPQTLMHWVMLLALGFTAWIGHEIYTRAHGFAPASVLTPFSYMLFLYMAFWGWIVFDQLPNASTLVGAALVVAAGVTIWWRETVVKPRILAAN